MPKSVLNASPAIKVNRLFFHIAANIGGDCTKSGPHSENQLLFLFYNKVRAHRNQKVSGLRMHGPGCRGLVKKVRRCQYAASCRASLQCQKRSRENKCENLSKWRLINTQRQSRASQTLAKKVANF